ncbi:hypothetical protein DNA98_06780 [Meiothermus sp. Pnk-1]|nr:hypothetical protein DNA98_06780 [Meiothermus sp. Pnk-1]
MVLALSLAVGFAAGALWWSVRAGVAAGFREPYLLTEGIPTSLCTLAQDSGSEVSADVGMGHAWGLGLMVPVPFLLVGVLGYLLYRSGLGNRPAKDGFDEWDS